MLSITGPTLELVRRILEAEGPGAQLTELTDGVLSQVVGVSRLIPGYGLGDGFWTVVLTNIHVATGTLYNSVNAYDAADAAGVLAGGAPFNRESSRIWCLDGQIFRQTAAGGDSVDAVSLGVDLHIGTWNRAEWIISRASAFGQAISAPSALPHEGHQPGSEGTTGAIAPVYHVPIRLDPGSSFRMGSLATVPAGPTNALGIFRAWIGPRGLNPPGVA